jgi:superfamily II DNA helicase RecQ
VFHPGIIYCFSKKDTEKVTADLQQALPSMRNKISFYHADVPPDVKEQRQRLWSKGDLKVANDCILCG